MKINQAAELDGGCGDALQDQAPPYAWDILREHPRAPVRRA